MSDRPDLALLNERQIARIRADLREVTTRWPHMHDLTERDAEALDHLYMAVAPEFRPGRGHDCRWVYPSPDLVITGSADVYGNGDGPMVMCDGDGPFTANGEEWEP